MSQNRLNPFCTISPRTTTTARSPARSPIKETGLGRESLYKAFRPSAKPRFETVMKVMDALELRLSTTPKTQATN